jgi:hypothetical protein
MVLDKTLIQVLVHDIAVPEILSFLKERRGEGETDESIQVRVTKEKDAIQAFGQAFLDETRGAGAPLD